MKEKKANKGLNYIKLILFTFVLGSITGLVVWSFLKAVSLSTEFIWQFLPEKTGFKYLTPLICAFGGLIVGILHKKHGDYPDELGVVLAKIQKEKHYDYHPIKVMLVCAFIPLVCGASVGPEAGLTGIIAALCYWIGDNVSYAKNNAAEFSQIGEAVTLGQLFRSPLFGIMAVEESDIDEKDSANGMSKANKFFLYGLSTAAGLLVAGVLNLLLGPAMEGFPSFSTVSAAKEDYLMLLLYVPVGLVLYFLFEFCEKITGKAAGVIPPVFRETICAVIVGITGRFFPVIIFSGEEQMGELIENIGMYGAVMLLVICILKIFLTSSCLKFGMKGGHFFPLIFACTCMGFALAGFFFPDPSAHAAFAAAAVTATLLGAQLKKPFTVTLLLLLCFPVRIMFWVYLCAAAGKAASNLFVKGDGNGEQKETV